MYLMKSMKVPKITWKEEYDELVNWLRGHSDYDTEIVPEYEDQILMLSTCSYHTKNGRFVVAARRVAEP